MSGEMEVKGPRKSLKLRRSLFPNVPPFVQFEDSSDLVTEKLQSLKAEPLDDEKPCQVWNMWIPYINQTVVRTVEQAGYRVARVEMVWFGDSDDTAVFRYPAGSMASCREGYGTLLMDLPRKMTFSTWMEW